MFVVMRFFLKVFKCSFMSLISLFLCITFSHYCQFMVICLLLQETLCTANLRAAVIIIIIMKLLLTYLGSRDTWQGNMPISRYPHGRMLEEVGIITERSIIIESMQNCNFVTLVI